MKLYQTSCIHTHTIFCDGQCTPAQMAQAAAAQGMRTLGFSGHQPMENCSWAMADEAAYRAAVQQLKEEWRGKLDILLGIEADFMGKNPPAGYDYWIGSTHVLRGPQNGQLYEVDASQACTAACLQDGFGGDAAAMLQAYYGQVVQMAALRPDVLGHFDLIVKTNGKGQFFDEESDMYRAIAGKALDDCIALGACFEINTGGIWRGWRETPYPADWMLRRIAQAGARVTITADAHQPQALGFGYEQAAARAAAAGIRQLWVYTAQGWQSCPAE